MSTAILALIGTLFGGSVVAVIQVFFLPKAKQADIATQIRDELRGDIAEYRVQLDDMQCEVDYYRIAWLKMTEIMIRSKVDIPPELLLPYKKDK